MGCNGFAFMILTLFCEFHVDNPGLKTSVLMKCSYRKVYLWGIEMIIEVGKGVVQNNSCIREIWPPIGAGSGIRKNRSPFGEYVWAKKEKCGGLFRAGSIRWTALQKCHPVGSDSFEFWRPPPLLYFIWTVYDLICPGSGGWPLFARLFSSIIRPALWDFPRFWSWTLWWFVPPW